MRFGTECCVRSYRGVEPGRPRECRRDALDGAASPRLVRVREPDQLGVERAHAQLAFGVRLVELTNQTCRVRKPGHAAKTYS